MGEGKKALRLRVPDSLAEDLGSIIGCQGVSQLFETPVLENLVLKSPGMKMVKYIHAKDIQKYKQIHL